MNSERKKEQRSRLKIEWSRKANVVSGSCGICMVSTYECVVLLCVCVCANKRRISVAILMPLDYSRTLKDLSIYICLYSDS